MEVLLLQSRYYTDDYVCIKKEHYDSFINSILSLKEDLDGSQTKISTLKQEIKYRDGKIAGILEGKYPEELNTLETLKKSNQELMAEKEEFKKMIIENKKILHEKTNKIKELKDELLKHKETIDLIKLLKEKL